MIYGMIYFGGMVGIASYLSFKRSIAIYRKRQDLPTKKLPKMWDILNAHLSDAAPEPWMMVMVFSLIWPAHFLGAGIYTLWQRVIKRFALSREERASIALGAQPKTEATEAEQDAFLARAMKRQMVQQSAQIQHMTKAIYSMSSMTVHEHNAAVTRVAAGLTEVEKKDVLLQRSRR